MAHKKGTGSTRNGRDSNPKNLGVKKHGGEQVYCGNIIVRQRGTSIHPGENVGRGKDHTLFAEINGIVRFEHKTRHQKKVSVYTKEDLQKKESFEKEQALKKKESFERKQRKRGIKKMAIMTKPLINGFRTLVVHAKLIDSPFDLENTKIGIIEIESQSQVFSDGDLGKYYLQKILEKQHSQKSDSKTYDFRVENIKTFRRTGTVSVKLKQYHKDIPLYGSIATVEFEKGGNLVSINSVIGELDDVSVDPTINIENILEFIKSLPEYSYTNHSLELQKTLCFYYDSNKDNRWRLVFMIHNVIKQTKDSSKMKVVDYIIDAKNPTITIVAELLRTQ